MERHANLWLTSGLRLTLNSYHSGRQVSVRLNRIFAQRLADALYKYAAGDTKNYGSNGFMCAVVDLEEPPLKARHLTLRVGKRGTSNR